MEKSKRKKIIKRIILSLLAISALFGLVILGVYICDYYNSKYLPQKKYDKFYSEFNTSNDSIKLAVAKELIKNDNSWTNISIDVNDKMDSLRREALNYIEKLAGNGDLDCQLLLARVYEYGDQLYYRVYQSRDKSIYWYKEAADNGDGYACWRIGNAYYWGLVINQDKRKAVNYLKKGAELNDPNALASYGDLFAEGVVVENPHEIIIQKDIEQAKYWWKKALEQGNESAKDRLQKVYN